MAAFMDAAERDPALADLHVVADGAPPPSPCCGSSFDGLRRGAFRSDVDPELVVDLLAAPFFYRRFVAHRP